MRCQCGCGDIEIRWGHHVGTCIKLNLYFSILHWKPFIRWNRNDGFIFHWLFWRFWWYKECEWVWEENDE